jgi:hypothetical protein
MTLFFLATGLRVIEVSSDVISRSLRLISSVRYFFQ